MKSQPRADARPIESFVARRSIWCVASILFLLTAAVYAYCTIFGKFRFYDDEGFMMVSVRGYLEGHTLYDSVSSVYGPFYYFWEYLLHTVTSLPVTHDVTGWFCIFHWLAASAILGLAGTSMTGSNSFGLFVFMQATVHLSGLSDEPGHPQELAALLLALAVLVANGSLIRRWRIGVLASIGAALFLTKSNLGVFYGIAMILAMVCHTPFFQSARLRFAPVLIASALVPFILMQAHLTERWAVQYSIMACVMFLAVAAIAHGSVTASTMGLSEWLEATFGFLGTVGILVTLLLATGSSISAIRACLVTTPAKFAPLFCVPLQIQDSAWVGGASLVCATLALALRNQISRLPFAIACCKGLYGIAGSIWLASHPNMQLEYLLPWAWLMLLPFEGQQPTNLTRSFSRTFLCLAACWQTLQAYPVAGTQVAVGTFLSVLVFSICLYDAISAVVTNPLLRNYSAFLRPSNPLLSQTFIVLVLLFLFAGRWCVPARSWRIYKSLCPLDLPGARYLRIQPFQVSMYHEISDYLRRECDSFVSVPGFNSLHFWAEKSPVSYFNVAEVLLLTDRQQLQVVTALQKAKRPLIVLNEQGMMPLSTVMGQGPLAQFIQGDCVEVRRFNVFRIMAPLRQYLQRSGAEANLPEASPDSTQQGSEQLDCRKSLSLGTPGASVLGANP